MLLASSILYVPFSQTKNAYAETANRLGISDFISYSEQDNEYKSFISKENFAQLNSGLEKNKMSKTEIYKEIYQELGYSDEEIEKIGPEEINKIMETSIEITVNQQYLRINKDGNQEILSKEECLKAAKAVNAERESQLQERLFQIQNDQLSSQEEPNTTSGTKTIGNDGNNAWAIDDTSGYMKITSRSDYINPRTVNNIRTADLKDMWVFRQADIFGSGNGLYRMRLRIWR